MTKSNKFFVGDRPMKVIALDVPFADTDEIVLVNTPRRELPFFCIPCLIRSGQLRRTSSPSFMCRKCSKLLRPHLTARVKRSKATMNASRAKGLRTEARLLAVLADNGEMDTTSIAAEMGMSNDGVRYGLRRLLAAGTIERRLQANRHYWKVTK